MGGDYPIAHELFDALMTEFTVTSSLFDDGGKMPISMVHPYAGGRTTART